MKLSRMAETLFVVLSCAIAAWGQSTASMPARITLRKTGSLLSVLAAIGQKTQLPLGIIEGKDYQRLCRMSGSFDFTDSDPTNAIRQVAARAGYTLTREGRTAVLTAPDLFVWQEKMLRYRFSAFPALRNVTMEYMGAQLTGWIQTEIGKAPGFGGSVMGSLDDRLLSLPPMHAVTASGIADRIVSLDHGGIWIARPLVKKPMGAKDEVIEIISYHDRPNAAAEISCGP